jgi:hypothetical protein
MSKLDLALLIFLACYTALAQPGLPPCWLEAEPCAHHHHVSQKPHSEHDHDYLRLQALSQTSVVILTSLVAASLLIVILGWTGITRIIGSVILTSKSWGLVPDPPPPRFSLHPSFSL